MAVQCKLDPATSRHNFYENSSRSAVHGRVLARYWGLEDMSIEGPSGPPLVYLASSVAEETLAENSRERLRSALRTLELCQASLANDAEHDTADLLSLAILQLRMKLKGVTDSELKLLCDVHADAEARARAAHKPKVPRARRRGRPVLRLVT
jgi:hypothetical protein